MPTFRTEPCLPINSLYQSPAYTFLNLRPFQFVCLSILLKQFTPRVFVPLLRQNRLSFSTTIVSSKIIFLSPISPASSSIWNCIKSNVVFTQQRESSGKCPLCISIKQHIDNMYTQVAIHASTIGSLAVSQFFSLLLLTAGNWIFSSSLFSWTSFSFFDSLDGVCRSRLTLLESEYCPTSFPTHTPKGIRYKSASPGPR